MPPERRGHRERIRQGVESQSRRLFKLPKLKGPDDTWPAVQGRVCPHVGAPCRLLSRLLCIRRFWSLRFLAFGIVLLTRPLLFYRDFLVNFGSLSPREFILEFVYSPSRFRCTIRPRKTSYRRARVVAWREQSRACTVARRREASGCEGHLS